MWHQSLMRSTGLDVRMWVSCSAVKGAGTDVFVDGTIGLGWTKTVRRQVMQLCCYLPAGSRVCGRIAAITAFRLALTTACLWVLALPTPQCCADLR
jgi:hypothetical protein